MYNNKSSDIIYGNLTINIYQLLTKKLVKTFNIYNCCLHTLIVNIESNLSEFKDNNQDFVLLYNDDIIYYNNFPSTIKYELLVTKKINLYIHYISDIHPLLKQYHSNNLSNDELYNYNYNNNINTDLTDINIFLILKYAYMFNSLKIYNLLPNNYKDNTVFMLKIIKNVPYAFKYASDNIKNNYNIVITLLNSTSNFVPFDYISDNLKDNYDVGLLLLQHHKDFYRLLSTRLRDNEELLIKALEIKFKNLKYASNRLKDNYNIVLKAVSIFSLNLIYASNRLKNNYDIVLEAVKSTGISYINEIIKEYIFTKKIYNYSTYNTNHEIIFNTISNKLQVDRNILLEFCRYKSVIFYENCITYIDDYELALESVKYSGLHLINVSNRLKDDYTIVYEAVKQNGNALKYASNRLKNNYNISLAAIKSKHLLYNTEYIKYQNMPTTFDDDITLKYIPDIFLTKYNIILEAVKKNGFALKYANKILQNNYKIVLKAVTNNGIALQYASYRLKNNYNIVLAAIKQNNIAIQYASYKLRNSYTIAIRVFPYSKYYCSIRIKNKYKRYT